MNIATDVAFLQKLIDELDEVIMLNEPDGRLYLVNQSYTRLLGYPIEELLNKRPEEQEHFFTEEDKNKVIEVVNRLLQGEGATQEIVYRHKDGRPVYTRITGRPLQMDGRVMALWTIVDLTEVKNKEKELEKANAMYDVIFNSSTEPCVITGRDWRWSKVNPAFEHLVGYSAKEILGKLDYEMPFWSQQEVTRLKESIKDKKPGEPVVLEISMKSKDRKDLHLLLNEVFVEEELNEWVGWISYLTDITELRKREEELKEAHEFTQNLFHAVPVPMSLMTPEGKRVDVNSKFERVYNRTRGEAIGLSIEKLYKETDVVKRAVEECKKTGFSVCEVTCIKGDGSTFPVIMNLTTIEDREGNIIHILGTATDITDLKQSQQQMSKIIEISPAAMVLTDEEGRWTAFNKAAERIFGFGREEVLGRKTPEQSCTTEETIEALQELWKSVIEERKEAVEGIDVPWKTKDGAMVIHKVYEVPFGKGQGRLYASIDITELKRATEKVAEVLNALALGDLTWKVDVSGLSGDLREMGESINKSIDSLDMLIKEAKNTAQMVSSTSQSLSASAEELSASTNQISGTVSQIAQGATDQASHIARVKKTTTDLRELSGRGALEAESTAKETARAAEEALMGSRAAQEAIDRTTKIFNVTSESALVVKFDHAEILLLPDVSHSFPG